ncbi:hypothetical protein [Pseudaminobacter soli (ex Li et al. 2025)]|uniref:Uncharacterized protein n=1 Tax=Pseudaminobacter soli (ex Li et al. 2025) TaxID=1295366 RepID=A0A2P7RZI4_9HYPH|nr:hypothetical protein [Mesorhizobium soli]PSJ55592.1 hypothetical protein C7I85_26420 [Mesorhizobium soli]
MQDGKSATIVGLNHDLKNKRSFVQLVWDDESDKHLSLAVRFGCSLDDLPSEAAKAVAELVSEVSSLRLNSVG